MKAILLTFTRIYGRLSAVIGGFRWPLSGRATDEGAGRVAELFGGRKKLRKSAVKPLKSFARVNLCAMRGEVSAPNGRLGYFAAKAAMRSRAPVAPAAAARA